MKALQYALTHEWLNSEEETMCIGITDHAQGLLGDMVYVELPTIGTEVHVGDEIGVLESVKAASEIYAPISGKVVAINPDLTTNPGLLNTDPYGAGWLVKIKPLDPETALEEISHLLKEEAYLANIAKEH